MQYVETHNQLGEPLRRSSREIELLTLSPDNNNNPCGANRATSIASSLMENPAEAKQTRRFWYEDNNVSLKHVQQRKYAGPPLEQLKPWSYARKVPL